MAITYIGGQISNPASTSGTTMTTGTLTAIGVGHSIVLSGQTNATESLSSVTDNGAGNTYVIQQTNSVQWSTFGEYFFIVTGLNIQGSPTTFTFTFSTSFGNNDINVNLDEFAGVGSINAVTPYANVATANPSASVTTTVANCALLSLYADAATYTSLPAGYTLGSNNSAADGYSNAYNLTSGAAGTYTATWTEAAGSNPNGIGMVALAPPASAAHNLQLLHVGNFISLSGLSLPTLLGAAAWRAGKAVRRNAAVSRRALLTGRNKQ